MLCQHSFGELADLHRSRASDITMLLVSAPTEESEKKGDEESLIRFIENATTMSMILFRSAIRLLV